jgi:KaiC/GvpD/RAD55 family RecA-like ATPase
MVHEYAERRALQAVAMDLHDRAAHGDPEEVKAELIERVTAIRPKGTQWAELDLRVLELREPEAPRHIIADWLPAGEVTLLAGHGGAGKSLLALHLAACIALGRPWCGIATERRRVLYVSAEDRADVLHWRLARIVAHLGITLEDLGDWLRMIDASAIDAELMIESDGAPTITPAYTSLRAQLRDAQMLVLDGASDLYGGSEIIRRQVRKYVRALRQLIDREGAVLLLAHLDKAAARDSSATDRYSGSTAWHNSVRSRWALGAEPDGDALLLTLAKANHARAGAEIRLRWDASAHLYLADAAPSDGGIVGSIRDRQERDGILAAMRACAAAKIIVPAAMQGSRTAYHVLSARPELPESLRSGPGAARRFRARIEELRHIPAFEEREMRRGNRHYTLGLVLTGIGSAPDAPHSEN